MIEQANQPTIYEVPEANLPLLQEKIAKLNRRAAKLGCADIVINVLGSKEVAIYAKDECGFETDRVAKYRKVIQITVTGAAPKINGWEFIAVIQPTFDEEGKNLGNILRGVPGATREVPAQYRSADNNCDHCKTWRRRNETYVLMNDAQESKQVGRNCLRDFLGHTNPEFYARYAEMLMDAADLAMGSEDADFFGGGTRHIDRYMAEEILQLAACSIRLNGWRSNKTAREYGSLSTSGEVSNWLFARADERKTWEKPLQPSDEDKATAAEVVEWLSGLHERTELNDYMYNLSVIGQGATFTTKNFGLACSAIPTYLREMEREINRRKQFEGDANSQHVGEVDKRSDFMNLTLVFTRDIEHEGYAYGAGTVTHMYKFKDEAGNVIVWFASNVYWNPTTKQDINVGDTVSLTATVKKHDVYQDREGKYPAVKQTVITRAVEYKTKEQKKAEAKERKAQRQKEEAERAANLANNPGYYNPYDPNFGKTL